jgi:glutamate formiminotransferase/formiminotetrahydrofolate cyclodeaminase
VEDLMKPLVECVPNFSEGRDPVVIKAITDAIAAVEGVSVLDIDPGRATNRTVVTLVGSPEAVVNGAFAGIAKAAESIDMSCHQGEHPRIGATDVCPFVPVRNITMSECSDLAHQLGERVGRELGIPVYHYEHAALCPERENLAVVRDGEYEGLQAKLRDPAWVPDHGPAEWSEAVSRTGATVIGARPFLIAFNVNLNTKNTNRAMKIAALIREKGIYRRNEDGSLFVGSDGQKVRDPGLFKCVKAIGWYIDDYDRCQISINFTDYRVSPPHLVVDAIRRVAEREGVVVTGCELVGLIPMEAMLQAGRYYLERQHMNPGVSEDALIEIAERSWGLSELGDFDPDQAIIERRIQQDGPLVGMTGRRFIDTLASDAPAPGGGSVAALCGAMSAGLSAMVAQLTTGKGPKQQGSEVFYPLAVQAQALKDAYLADVDADTAAFGAIMQAFTLPKGTREEKLARRAAVQAATQLATQVPLRVLERTVQVIALAETAATGNPNARSDAGVAGLVAQACAEGAWYNVCINLKGLRDKDLGASYRSRADAALKEVNDRSQALREKIRAELGG